MHLTDFKFTHREFRPSFLRSYSRKDFEREHRSIAEALGEAMHPHFCARDYDYGEQWGQRFHYVYWVCREAVERARPVFDPDILDESLTQRPYDWLGY